MCVSHDASILSLDNPENQPQPPYRIPLACSCLTHFKSVDVDGSALEERTSRVVRLQHGSFIIVSMVTTKRVRKPLTICISENKEIHEYVRDFSRKFSKGRKINRKACSRPHNCTKPRASSSILQNLLWKLSIRSRYYGCGLLLLCIYACAACKF